MARKIIFDTDPGVDDCLALLIAARSPALDLIGVTTVYGNASIEDVTRNALVLKDIFGFDAPVAQGAGVSLNGQGGTPPAHIHGVNGMGDARLPAQTKAVLDPRPAHQLIIDLVRENPNEVTIIAVGRMTNLALALQQDPEISKLVDEVVIMGGAFSFKGPNGNVSPVAEANIIGDPLAADIIFGAEWKVTAISLDVTRETLFSPEEFVSFAKSGDRALQFVAEATDLYIDFHRSFNVEGCYIHDSSAVIFAIEPSLFTLRHGPVRVICDGIAIGQTILVSSDIAFPVNGWKDRPIQAASESVDVEGVRNLILKTIYPAGL